MAGQDPKTARGNPPFIPPTFIMIPNGGRGIWEHGASIYSDILQSGPIFYNGQTQTATISVSYSPPPAEAGPGFGFNSGQRQGTVNANPAVPLAPQPPDTPR